MITLASPASGAVSEREGFNAAASPRSANIPPSRPETCPDARRGLAYYHRQYHAYRPEQHAAHEKPRTCARARYLAERWRGRARAARSWWEYHYDWQAWLPDKWQRIGACETGYGKRPGDWRWNSGTYQGAFGFYHGSWDAFVPRADPKAGPYPSEAYLATPRQQYEVALAIWRMYGFSGWGCRGA